MEFPGIILAGEQKLSAVMHPLAAELAPCYWLLDVQSGPFDSRWLDASPENQAMVERKWVNVPACDGSASCWRPHTFPQLADHVVIDEWTYFFAMNCREEDLARRAEWIVRRIGKMDAEFFGGLGGVADLFLFHADGWWEFYAPQAAWRVKLAAAFPTGVERSWREAGEPPREREFL